MAYSISVSRDCEFEKGTAVSYWNFRMCKNRLDSKWTREETGRIDRFYPIRQAILRYVQSVKSSAKEAWPQVTGDLQ